MPATGRASRRFFLLALLSLLVGLIGTGALVRGGLVWTWGPVAIAGAIGLWASAIRAVSGRARAESDVARAS